MNLVQRGELKGTEIHWEGDALDVLRSFPAEVRADLGAELRRLQEGDRPCNSRPMNSIGKSVFEVREQDNRAWYRVIYMARIKGRIYVLHCFEKKSAKTSRNDLWVAKTRYKSVLARLERERQSEKEIKR